ncbi:MAG: hypothetical protein HC904_11270 [Blastochloris sp.]|nr:hypothetical protein [Blastochloris sp.]
MRVHGLVRAVFKLLIHQPNERTYDKKAATLESTEKSGEGTPVTIKLSEVATSYMNALQRLFDYTCMTLGSMRLVNENDYDEFSKSMGIMPASKARLGYDDAREETELWLLKHMVSEGLGACLLAMSDARTICALSEWKAGGEQNQEELKRVLGPEKQDFDLSGVEEKFKTLKDKYKIDASFKDHIERIGKLRGVLMRGGKVTEQDVTEDGALVLKLKMVQLQTAPLDATDLSSMKVSTQLTDLEKSFKVDQRVRLNKNEQVAVIITLAFFLTNLLEGVQQFGKTQGMGK